MTPRTQIELVVLGALWGAAFLFVRIAAPEFGPVPLIAVRVAIAAGVLLGWLRVRGLLHALRPVALPLLLVGAINTAVPFTLFAFAALSLPAGLTSTINASVPLFGALVGFVWLRDRPAPLRVVGLLVGFAGVLTLAWPRLAAGESGLAVAAAVAATMLYGVAAHATQRLVHGVPPLVVAAGSQVASALLLCPLAPFFWPDTAPGATAWGSAVVLGVACTAIAYVLYFRLLARAGPSVAMAVTYLIPVFGVAWGALFLGERLAGTSMAGGLLVMAGVALTTWTPRRVRP